MSMLFEALDTAADGAFIINEDLEIVYWNQAAQKIVGFRDMEVLGQHCYQVLNGHDEHHRLVCRLRCPVAKLAFGGEAVDNYDVRVRTAWGNSRWLNMSIFTYPENQSSEEKRFMVHLFRDISQKRSDEILLRRVLEFARRYPGPPEESEAKTEPPEPAGLLTAREHEVLTLMARGFGTFEIAQQLFISHNTVRNHIQHILQKLHVHTRLEAVTYAIRYELVD